MKILPWIKSAAVVMWLSLFVHVILLPFSLAAVGSIGGLLAALSVAQMVIMRRLTGQAVPKQRPVYKWAITGLGLALVVALHFSPTVMVIAPLAAILTATLFVPVFFNPVKQTH